MKVALPAYLPDQSANSGVLSECDGVYPRVDGYAPHKAFVEISEALPATFKGGASCIADDGTSYLLAGHAEGLSKYTGGAWSDLVTSMSVSEQWRFVTFGNYAIGVNGVATKVVDLNAGTAGDLTDAPVGKSIAVVGDYVVIGQDTNDLLAVVTSKVNDHTGWDITDGATYNRMLAGGEVMGLAGGEYGVILQRSRIVRMSQTGDADAPFTFDPIAENIGCAAKGSVASYQRTVFFLSDNGFMALNDGQGLVPIGSEQVDTTFKKEVPPEDYDRIFAAVDPQRKLVVWDVIGSPGKRWIYNYELKRWSTVTLTTEGVFSGFTSSQTLEEVAADYPDLDTMPYSLDDPRFAGGAPQFYGVQDSKIGAFTGANLKATFQMGHMEPVEGRVARISAVRPVTDLVEDSTLTLALRSRMGDEPVVKTCGELRDSGIKPVRASGRYVRPRWEIPAGAVWTYVQGFEMELEAGGKR